MATSHLHIPEGTILSPAQPYSRELLERIITGIANPGREFTGYLAIHCGTSLYLLCYLRGKPYGAGVLRSLKAHGCSLHELFSQLSAHLTPSCMISVHATDPVLLKSLLVLLHNEAMIISPVDLLRLDDIIQRISTEWHDALIVLERNQWINLFFIKDGVKGASYYSDARFAQEQQLSVHEQALLYAYQEHDGVTRALVYRDLTTCEASDAADLTTHELLHMVYQL